MKPLRLLKQCFFGALFLLPLAPGHVRAEQGTPLILATTATSDQRVMLQGETLAQEHPGWFVELAKRAGQECGSPVEFAFMPWARALEMVKAGQVSAAFNSSYKLDRAEYGAYPMKDGQPDERKASKTYVYRAYISEHSPHEALINSGRFDGLNVAVERAASIIPVLEEAGAQINETAKDVAMLQMVAAGHVDVAVGIEDKLDREISENETLTGLLKKVETPVQQSTGYVMFSKAFYASNKDLVECFWNKSAELKNTDWFKEMQATYE